MSKCKNILLKDKLINKYIENVINCCVVVLNLFMFPLHPGTFPVVGSRDQDTLMISASAPVSSISTDSRSEFLSQQQEHQPDEHNRNSKKLDRAKGSRAAVLSPSSASSVRRSPRFKVAFIDSDNLDKDNKL